MLENVMKFFAVRFVFSSLFLSPSFFSTPHQPFSTTASSDELFHLVSPPPLFFYFVSCFFSSPVLMFFYSVFVTEMHSAHSTLIKFNLTSKTVPLFPQLTNSRDHGHPPWIIAANSLILFDLIINQ